MMSQTLPTNKRFNASSIDSEEAVTYLLEHGYVLIENMLPNNQLIGIRDSIAEIFAAEIESPLIRETVLYQMVMTCYQNICLTHI